MRALRCAKNQKMVPRHRGWRSAFDQQWSEIGIFEIGLQDAACVSFQVVVLRYGGRHGWPTSEPRRMLRRVRRRGDTAVWVGLVRC
jgi:hypothetical protein